MDLKTIGDEHVFRDKPMLIEGRIKILEEGDH
jgi:hypothetical protein